MILKIFYMSLFGRFPFWRPNRFLEIICPRYDPDFFSHKLNKSPGYEEISFNVVKKYFSGLYESLKHIFNLSIETRVFPDKLKIAFMSPEYKADDSCDLITDQFLSSLAFLKLLKE